MATARSATASRPATSCSSSPHQHSDDHNAAGEDIHYLARDQAQAATMPNHDYWLFDSRTLVRMHFDDADVFLGGEIVEEPAEIVQHNYWRDVAWHHAVRRDDFATEEHLRRV
ncbi:MAG: DUF6879 family protein [Pseudonocardiaceae bacterium]